MAINYDINVNTNQGIQALNNLQTKVSGLNTVFGSLKNVVAGLALGSAVKSVILYADGIQDLSDVTGIAIKNIVGFGKALDAFGGNSEIANKAILKLTGSIGDAASGNAGLQDAFARVGVSLQDLRTLSEQDLLAKTIEGLESLTDKSEQVLLKQQLLGKEFRGIGLDGLSAAYTNATETSAKYAESIQKAAELQGNLDKALGAVKLSLLQTIAPVVDFINAFNPEKLQEFIDTLGRFIQVLAGLFIISKVSAGLTALGAAFASLAPIIATATAAILKFVIWPIRIITLLAALNEAIKFAFDFDPVEKFVEYVKGAASAIGAVLPEFLKFNKSAAGAGRGGSPEITKQLQQQGEEMRKQSEELKKQQDALKNKPTVIRDVTDAFAKQRITINATSDAFKDANKKIIENLNLETSLIGKSKEFKDSQKSQQEILQRAAEEVDKLTDAKSKLSAEEQRAGLGSLYDQQIKKINEIAQADAKRSAEAIKNNNVALNVEQLRLFANESLIDLQNKANDLAKQSALMLLPLQAKGYAEIELAAIEAAKAKIQAEEVRRGEKLDPAEQANYYKAARQGIEETKAAQDELNVTTEKYNLLQFSLRSQFDLQKKIRDIQHEMSTATLSGISKKYADIEKAARDAAEAQIQAEEVRTGKELDENQRKAYYETARKGIEELKQAETESYEASRNGLTGLKKALNEYVDDATNAAKNVENVFRKATQGMEDMIVKFAKTGKFEFKEFVNSMLEDLLRSQIRQTMANLFTMSGNQVKGGGGGLFGGSIIPGILAAGGPVSDRRPYIVGERGPELFIPNSAGSMVPNSGLTSGSNVTYNISAVDAMSFKQMIARDPSFIHAVAMQGGKTVPARR
jgi:lambda family phage tail tape measure protein